MFGFQCCTDCRETKNKANSSSASISPRKEGELTEAVQNGTVMSKHLVQAYPAGVLQAAKVTHAMTRPETQLRPARQEAQSVQPNREEEKKRLQRVVNEFVRQALPGRPCTFLDPRYQVRMPARLRVPKNLLTLSVVVGEEPFSEAFRCDMANIKDVYSYAIDGRECFDPVLVGLALPQELDLLLTIVCNDGSRLHILEDTLASRDILLECLKILCVYAQAAMQKQSSG
eukprot:CAMPEP_0206560944 /NCGR_PEP_ID=MMETSP0325_2-20121206/21321_1 /ASSEMBLY_ACC=CAM_ASM_000347 /TAXON_ID=2866 /ORGANISM="Crypthecodinium cohnii, Strain Seligo" /LENGTH=228 /DNA_ID=CAMNT_0054062793 /DNA_START=333 /DNA_END=1019 /DNA_ORIENTATION=+